MYAIFHYRCQSVCKWLYEGASDKRAIKEYINHYCPKLKKEGIQKIAFIIIISNTFKSGFSEFINYVTWKTDIKRFELLSQFLHKIQLA